MIDGVRVEWIKYSQSLQIDDRITRERRESNEESIREYDSRCIILQRSGEWSMQDVM